MRYFPSSHVQTSVQWTTFRKSYCSLFFFFLRDVWVSRVISLCLWHITCWPLYAPWQSRDFSLVALFLSVSFAFSWKAVSTGVIFNYYSSVYVITVRPLTPSVFSLGVVFMHIPLRYITVLTCEHINYSRQAANWSHHTSIICLKICFYFYCFDDVWYKELSEPQQITIK